ncbi:MAG TPA: hypothetical protein VK335_05795 [Bryobacteraceae bacterium]|nr:hypothetical protein [Bryobacteraceae bacterium]
MKHLNEEDLVLHYYGEGAAGAGEHLETCDACRASFESLARVLRAMDRLDAPEPLEGYEGRVWNRLRPELKNSREHWWNHLALWLTPRHLGGAAAMAALLVAAFLAGRVSQQRQQVAGLSGPVRERIMLVAVGEHLERSQMILVELINNASAGPVDITEEQERARDLVDENRLYRQVALKSGDTGVSSVLDELERTLLEVAHSPSKLDSVEFARIRERIEAEGILFKIRVVGSNLRERERSPLGPQVGKAL